MNRLRYARWLLLAALCPWPALAQDSAAVAGIAADRLGDYLLEAARAGDASLIAELLKAGVDPETRNAKGHTALTLAAYAGRLQALEVLIDAGADVNSADQRGNTPLMGAIFKGDAQVFTRLLGVPAIALDQRNAAGQTALMYAALFSREPMIDALLERGADASLIDANGHRAGGLARDQGNAALAARLDAAAGH